MGFLCITSRVENGGFKKMKSKEYIDLYNRLNIIKNKMLYQLKNEDPNKCHKIMI